jgi:hypothetical protein
VVSAFPEDETLDPEDLAFTSGRVRFVTDDDPPRVFRQQGEESLGEGKYNLGVVPVVEVGDPGAEQYVVKIVHRAGGRPSQQRLAAARREHEVAQLADQQDRFLLAPVEASCLHDDPDRDAFLVYRRYRASLSDVLGDPDMKAGLPADVCRRLVVDVAAACERMRLLTSHLEDPMVAHGDIAPSNVLISSHAGPDRRRELLDGRTQFVLTDAGASPRGSRGPATRERTRTVGHERYCPHDPDLHRSLDSGSLGLLLIRKAELLRSGALRLVGRLADRPANPWRLTPQDLRRYPRELRPLLAGLGVPAVGKLRDDLVAQLDVLPPDAPLRPDLLDQLRRWDELADLRGRTNPLRAPLWAAELLALLGEDLAIEGTRLEGALPRLQALLAGEGEGAAAAVHADAARRREIRAGHRAGRDATAATRWQLATALLGEGDLDLATLLADLAASMPSRTDDRVWGFVLTAAAGAPAEPPDEIEDVRWPRPLWPDIVRVTTAVAVIMVLAVLLVSRPFVRDNIDSMASASSSLLASVLPGTEQVDPYAPAAGRPAGPVREVTAGLHGRRSLSAWWTDHWVEYRFQLDAADLPSDGPWTVAFDSDELGVVRAAAHGASGPTSLERERLGTEVSDPHAIDREIDLLTMVLRPLVDAPEGLLEGRLILSEGGGRSWDIPVRYGHAPRSETIDATLDDGAGAWSQSSPARYTYADGNDPDDLDAGAVTFNHGDTWLAGWGTAPGFPLRVLEPDLPDEWSWAARLVPTDTTLVVAYLVAPEVDGIPVGVAGGALDEGTGSVEGELTLRIWMRSEEEGRERGPAFVDILRVDLAAPDAATVEARSQLWLHTDQPAQFQLDVAAPVQLLELEEYAEDPERTDRPWLELESKDAAHEGIALPGPHDRPRVLTFRVTSDSTPVEVDGSPVHRDRVAPRDCLVFTTNPRDLDGAVTVPCGGTHHAQVAAIIELPEEDDDPPALRGISEDRCLQRVESMLSDPERSYREMPEWVNSYWPDRAAWAAGDRRLICTLFDWGHTAVDDGAILEREGFS